MSIELPMPLCPGPDCLQPEEDQSQTPGVGGVADTAPNEPGELEAPPQPEEPDAGEEEPQAAV